MSDRLIQQSTTLLGVRFGATTQYCLLDIDIGSQYHPRQDLFAIARILAALEPLGLVSHVACTSSYSGGIHLYFPFEPAQKTWMLAIALQVLLENAGLNIAPGQLELFPNVRTYSSDAKPTLYAAHRLPLQIGSYLLNTDWQPIYSTPNLFVQQWRVAQQRNTIDLNVLSQALKQNKRGCFRLSGRADKFLNDLNADIEPGWTSFGQTNYMLGRIALRSYIFGHLLYAAQPLEGQLLVDDIVRTAQALPGYQQWCRHQHEIYKRAEEWARCVESSRYFHFGDRSTSSQIASAQPSSNSSQDANSLTWNQRQAQAARERICQAIAHLLDQNALPAGATARFRALTQQGIGGSSLYRHRDLWHPCFLETSLIASKQLDDTDQSSGQRVEFPPNPPVTKSAGRGDQLETSPRPWLTSLFPPLDRNGALGKAFRSVLTPRSDSSGRNRVNGQLPDCGLTQLTYAQRLQRYLESGDPILVNEAMSALRSLSSLPKPLDTSSDQGSARCHPRAAGLWREADAPPDARIGSVDLSDTLAAITVQLRRLHWTHERKQRYLLQRFNKNAQSQLNDLELLQWLEWLTHQTPTASDSAQEC